MAAPAAESPLANKDTPFLLQVIGIMSRRIEQLENELYGQPPVVSKPDEPASMHPSLQSWFQQNIEFVEDASYNLLFPHVYNAYSSDSLLPAIGRNTLYKELRLFAETHKHPAVKVNMVHILPAARLRGSTASSVPDSGVPDPTDDASDL